MKKTFRVLLLASIVTVAFMIAACATDAGVADVHVTIPVDWVDTGTAIGQGSSGFVGGGFGLLGNLNVPATEVFQADIVIVGGGAAGMTAALEVLARGVGNIVILEKTGFLGGNAMTAWGGMAGAGTRYQPANVNHVEEMISAGLAAGQNLNNAALVRILAENSAAAVHWVNDLGANLVIAGAARMHSTPDTIAGTANLGGSIGRALSNAVREAGVPIMLNTQGTNILMDAGGRVMGVRALRNSSEVIDIKSSAVILATGGFGANRAMINAHSPRFSVLGLRSHPGTLGGGLVMAHDIGADILDMNFMTVTDTMDPATLITHGPAPRTSGGILVNMQGQRFSNELIGGEALAFGLAVQTNSRAYFIFDENARARAAGIFNNFYAASMIRTANSVAALAGQIGIPSSALEATVARYNAFAAAGLDEDFGRATMFPLSGTRFYAMPTVPAVAGTSGGVRINTHAEVLRPYGTAIQGLFAGGEVTGGVMGYSRAGGHSLADAVVFGRIAAATAATFVLGGPGLTQRTEAVPQVQGNFSAGIHRGTARAHNGPLSVAVTVLGGNIVDIEVTEHRETSGFFEGARDSVVTQVIRNQSTINVDRVAGATMTSFGLVAAINDALR